MTLTVYTNSRLNMAETICPAALANTVSRLQPTSAEFNIFEELLRTLSISGSITHCALYVYYNSPVILCEVDENVREQHVGHSILAV